MSDKINAPVVQLDPARHRLATLNFLAKFTGFAVEAKRGDKAPLNWDPANNDKANSDRVLERLRGNDNNVGAHFWGTLVDVDIDSESSFIKPALDMLLPHTAHVYGRPSSPRSHRLYTLKLTSESSCLDRKHYPILDRLERHAKVEIRGGGLADGMYSLLPGSIHPNGELYTWEDPAKVGGAPNLVTPEQLISAVRKACALAFLAEHWTEGQRNPLCLALAGFLFRLFELGRDLELNRDQDAFIMDKDEALRFLFALMRLAGDDRKDEYPRKKSFLQTWDKGAEGVPITGAKRIAEIAGDPKLITQLYAMLSDDLSIGNIDMFLARFAIFVGPGLFVDIEAAGRGADMSRVLMTKQAFDVSYAHHRYVDDAGKSKALTQRLPAMTSAIRVDGFTMDPGSNLMIEKRGDVLVNLWGGFQVQPFAGAVTDVDVQMFLDYVREVICSGNPKYYEWVMRWMAHIFQDPSNKPGTALVLVGKPGTGKTFLHEHILRPIIGPSHSVANNNIYNLTRDFNSMYANKLLIACDEATSRRQKDAFEKLKTIITDKEMRVEPKGKDAFSLPNPARILMTSNYALDAVHLPDGKDDRRYMVLAVSNARKGQAGYWTSFIQWLGAENQLAKIHRYLLDLPIDKTLVRTLEITPERREIELRSLVAFDQWLMRMIERGFPLDVRHYLDYWDAIEDRDIAAAKSRGISHSNWPEYVTREALVADYEEFRRIHGKDEMPISEAFIGSELVTRGLKPEGKPYQPTLTNAYCNRTHNQFSGKPRLYPFPKYEAIVAYLVDAFGYRPPALDDGDQDPATDQVEETPSDDEEF